MIDFHTHILPRMDDGSRRMAETQKMLKMEYDQGVRQVVASSHFYAQHEFPETFLDRRGRRLARVREILHEEEWGQEMQIFGGAEVLYYNGMADSPMLPSLCIEGTDTLLLEMPFSQWDKEVYREVRKIIEHRRIKVILAHVERYSSYQKNKDIWEEILDLPLTIQLNAGEILQFGKSAPNIAEEAITPTVPTSPSTKKNVALGGILALALIVGIYTVRFLMDDTVKTAEDVEKIIGVMPLTVILEYQDKDKKKQGRHRRK